MELIKNKKRIVIKIGSALLVEAGKVRESWLDSLAQDIKFLQNNHIKIIIVSSGAIALGRHYLKTKNQKLDLGEKQAAAAIGQIELMSFYKNIFVKEKINIAQILLTGSESSERQKYLNARQTFDNLLKNNIIPIVNENDSIATEEIKIGDNDRLAARVAQMVGADLLILFSDIDGLYEENPKINSKACFIPLVNKITKDIEAMATGTDSDIGTGGMITKIKAAKMAFNSACDVVIADGRNNHPIKKLQDGGKFTLFAASGKKISSRKNWIADGFNPRGEIIINDCACEALLKGSSLLPIGVEKISGDFSKGDQILIKDTKNNHIATGLAAYAATKAQLIIGKKTVQIKELFGKSAKEELVHRDDLVIIN